MKLTSELIEKWEKELKTTPMGAFHRSNTLTFTCFHCGTVSTLSSPKKIVFNQKSYTCPTCLLKFTF